VNHEQFEARLGECLGVGRIARQAPLAPLTTFKVGGPADWFVDVQTLGELTRLLRIARDAGVPVTILGGGSNVLIGDGGVRGLVIRLRFTAIVSVSPDSVRVEAGVTMNGLVRWTVGRGLGRLEAWAGTPGTIGGAIYGNAHYGGRNIGDLVTRAMLVEPGGGEAVVSREDLAFGYDTSRLKLTHEILVWVEFAVAAGVPEELRRTARASLAFRKRTQPLEASSAGCIFQNPDPARERLPAGVAASAGALIDRAGLKGTTEGGARISPAHANFFVNEGHATARDLRALIERARETVRDRFGVTLRDEIMMLGEF
jgi:UDP-N-acetylmuramate dehydrogenase